MAFCPSETITPGNLNAAFPSSVLIPSQGPRDSNERLTEDQLRGIYNGLIDSAKIVTTSSYNNSYRTIGSDNKETEGDRNKPVNTQEFSRIDTAKINLATVGATEKATMDSIRAEFCYYYSRYKFSLNDLFDNIITTSSGSTLSDSQKDTINNKLDVVKGFNTKLNDLVQITNYIAIQRANEMGSDNTNINALNTKITATYGKLAAHNATLRKESAISDLRKQMVEFSQEKNLSANNLLALYGFLNFVSLGLLFYIYRK